MGNKWENIKEEFKEIFSDNVDDGIKGLKLKDEDVKKLLSMEVFRLTKEVLFIALMFLFVLYLPAFYLDSHNWIKGITLLIIYIFTRFSIDKLMKLPEDNTYTEYDFYTVNQEEINSAISFYSLFFIYYKGVLIVYSLYIIFGSGCSVLDVFNLLFPFYLFGVLLKTIENMLFVILYKTK